VARGGLPGFGTVLRSIIEAWKSEREKLVDSAAQIRIALQETYRSQAGKEPEELGRGPLADAFDALSVSYDEQFGGFGVAPKFPTPSNLFFLLRYYVRQKQRTAIAMIMKTLERMAAGGIHDQLGGGFHRYSTDRYWLVPHFEKMLYDNALLAIAYIEAHLVTHSELFRMVATDTLDWMLREMTSPNYGGFYSAQDADSPGGEGAYYLWNREQITSGLRESGLDGKAANLLCSFYSVTAEGNFEDGQTILTAQKDLASVASEFGMDVEEARRTLALGRGKLLEARMERPRPLTDDKIIAGWNGLAISALSKAYSAFGEDRFLSAAERCAEYVLSRLARKGSDPARFELFRRYRDGEAKEKGTLEDYAFLANAMIDLYEASFDARRLQSAVALAETMIALFYDGAEGGFFMSEKTQEGELIERPKEAYDGAIPSGNSMAALVLLRLHAFTEREEFREKAKSTLRAFSRAMANQPQGFPQMLVALDLYLGPTRQIIVSGDPSKPDTQALVHEVRRRFLPESILALACEQVRPLVPSVEGRIPGSPSEQAKVFVCTNNTCKLPALTPDVLAEQLDS
jgi:uncharacterized protein YyaL (SSP411 family)